MRKLVLPLFLVLSVASGDSNAGHGPSSSILADPLRWDDLVVRGVVQSVAYETIPAAGWYPPALLQYEDEPVRVAKVTISVQTLFRGKVDGPEVVIYSRRPKGAHVELFFNERIHPDAEVVATGLFQRGHSRFTMHSVFARTGDGWSKLGETGWGSPIPLHEIEDRVASVSLPAMTRDSDLVIRGTILSAADVGDPGNSYRVYVVRPDKVLKGSPTESVRVSANGSVGTGEGDWRTLLPYELEEGTSWYLFLTRRGEGYVPTAGRRSAFMVSGPNLFENLNVPSSLDPSTLEKDVGRFASE